MGVILFAALGSHPLVAQSAFKTLSLGVFSAEGLATFLDSRGVSARARSMVLRVTIAPRRTPIDLVKVSAGDLGLRDGSTYPELIAAARKRGLEMCPGEVGPLLQYEHSLDMPLDEVLWIAMEPVMSGITPARTVFIVAHSGLVSGYADGPIDKQVLWVFARAKTAPAQDSLEEGIAAHNNQDFATAMRLLRPLADRGVAAAQNRIGIMYDAGQSIPLNYIEAAKWYRLAAEQGYPEAQFNIGVLYDAGRGVSQDYELAYMWVNLAASSLTGNGAIGAANRRDAIASKMAPAQIGEAQAMSRRCKAQSFKGCS
jgi:hypothetical protein